MSAIMDRPELDYVAALLERELAGVEIRTVDVKRSIVLRSFLPGTPDQVLGGHVFGTVRRRGNFLLFDMQGPNEIEMVVLPVPAGRFAFAEDDAPPPRDISLAFALSDGRTLLYRDGLQRGKVYVIKRGSWKQVPGLETIGIDVLDGRVFNRFAFHVLARDRREQAKAFLTDPAEIDIIGPGYADEMLWQARVHPRSPLRTLDADELDRLYEAVVGVFGEARTRLQSDTPGLNDVPAPDYRIRGTEGEPCPRCGQRLVSVRVFTDDAVLCPHCQPEKRQGNRIEWRRVAGAT